MQIKSLLVLLTMLIACTFASARTAPRIVKIVHLKNQTGQIGPITLYTPQKAGLFRLSTFLLATIGNGSDGLMCESFGFTDSVGPGTEINACLGSQTKGDANSGALIVESVGGAPITLRTFSVSGFGTTAGLFYNVDVVVEELPDEPED